MVLSHKMLVESVQDYAIFLLDREGVVQSWNRGAELIKGYMADEIIGRHFSLFYEPEAVRRNAPQQNLEVARREGACVREGWRLRKDGSRFLAHVTIQAISDDAHSLRGFAKVTRDLTEQRKVEAELKRLSAKLMEAQEAERKRLSRELHDELGQALTALSRNLESIKERLSQETGARAQLQVDDSRQLIAKMLEQVRELSLALRPAMLDDLGLVPALRWYVERFKQRSGIDVHLVIRAPHTLPEKVEVTLYRVVQEALTNVMRHADAQSVTIQLASGEDKVMLLVVDDGRGLESEAEDEAFVTRRGTGLRGLRERAALLDGRVELWSEPGEGTEIMVQIPLKREEGTA